MPISQNLLFTGEAEPDEEFDHPAGVSIARLLKEGLTDRDWAPSRIENWRDCGWSIACVRGRNSLQVVVASTTVGCLWILQIAATFRPGIVGRLFGRPATAGPKEILALAKDGGSILSADGRFTDFKWCWDGYPEGSACTSEPIDAT